MGVRSPSAEALQNNPQGYTAGQCGDNLEEAFGERRPVTPEVAGSSPVAPAL
jgi:hypothetical protein